MKLYWCTLVACSGNNQLKALGLSRGHRWVFLFLLEIMTWCYFDIFVVEYRLEFKSALYWFQLDFGGRLLANMPLILRAMYAAFLTIASEVFSCLEAVHDVYRWALVCGFHTFQLTASTRLFALLPSNHPLQHPKLSFPLQIHHLLQSS